MENENTVREYVSIFGWGDKVKDILTDFEGRISQVHFKIGNNVKYTVQSTKLNDGKPSEIMVNENQLKLIERCNATTFEQFSGTRESWGIERANGKPPTTGIKSPSTAGSASGKR